MVRVWLLVVLVACGARTDLPGLSGSVDSGVVPLDTASVDATVLDAPSGCRGLPRSPRVLVQDDTIEPAVLALRDDTLFFGANDVLDPRDEPSGGLYQVSTAGGMHERLGLAEPYYANVAGLLTGADYLVYHQVEISPSMGGWTFEYPAIVVERGDEARVLPTGMLLGTAPMALLGDRLIFGRADPEDVGSIGLYEARSGTETTIGEANVSAAVGAARNAYLWTFDEGEGVLLRITAATDVIELERFDDPSCCWPWAADAQALYLWRRGRIEAWPVGEGPITIAEVSAPKFASVGQDDDRLYWTDESQVSYVAKEGGDVQTLVEETGQIRAVTTDGCGVYYSVTNPPRVMEMSAP